MVFEDKRRLALAGIVCSIVFFSNYSFIINHFFAGGAYLLDSGLFAGLVYKNPLLQQAVAVSAGTYFSTHFAPILQLFSLLSYLLPFPLPFYYAFTQGLVYTVVALGGLVVLSGLFKKSSRLWGLGVLSLLFAYSGIVQASVGYPHFEPIYAGWVLLFMDALAKRRSIPTLLFFVLTLIVREDTGFHLFGYIFPLFLLTWVEKDLNIYRKPLGVFSALAFLYAVTVILCQKIFFRGDSAITRIYLGDPAFAHLTWDFVQARSVTLWNSAAHALLPWMCLLIGAVHLRSLSFAVGFIAVLPWVTLNSLAISDAAGSLFSYYSYPLIVSLAWPSVWFRLQGAPESKHRFILGLQALVLLLSFGIYTHRDPMMVQQLFSPPAAVTFADYRALEAVVDEKLAEGTTYFDASLAALFPQKIGLNRRIHRDRDNSQIKSLMGFYGSLEMDLAFTVARSNSLRSFSIFKRFPIYLASQSEGEVVGKDWSVPITAPNEQLSIWMMSTTPYGTRDFSDMSVNDSGTFGHIRVVLFGPHLPFEPGFYQFKLDFKCEALDTSGEIDFVRCEVLVDGRALTEQTLKLVDSMRGVETRLQVPFEILAGFHDGPVEIRVWRQGKTKVRFERVELTKG